ncbi:unnamed protein product [Discosporangium mesarthrocarpum]
MSADQYEFDPNHARVLVVGPMESGKTSLVHYLCHGKPLAWPTCTIGCGVEVKLLSGEVDRFIEFWDVGGHSDAAATRRAFYEGADAAGVILVYDLSNPRYLTGLVGWVDELRRGGVPVGLGGGSIPEGDQMTFGAQENVVMGVGSRLTGHGFPGGLEELDELEDGMNIGGMHGKGVPLLVVGNKSDIRVQKGVTLADVVPPGFFRHHTEVCSMALDDHIFEDFLAEVFAYHTARARARGFMEEEGGRRRVTADWKERTREGDDDIALDSSQRLANLAGVGVASTRPYARRGGGSNMVDRVCPEGGRGGAQPCSGPRAGGCVTEVLAQRHPTDKARQGREKQS